jgi:hypothetical protein
MANVANEAESFDWDKKEFCCSLLSWGEDLHIWKSHL